MVFEAVFTKKLKKQVVIRKTLDAYKLVKSFAKSRQEQLVVITMDSTWHVLGVHVVNIGLTNYTPVSVKDIFYKAIMDNATFVIICHNHQGDLIEPSEGDLKFTDKIYKAGTIMDITVKDQLIISEYGYSSIKPSVEAVMKGEIKI
jgi:DNA repair protein RadC